MLHYGISITQLASSNKLHCAVFCQPESILYVHLLLAQHHGRQVFLHSLVTSGGCNSLGLIEVPKEKGGARVAGWRPLHRLIEGQTQQSWSCSSRAPVRGRSVRCGQVLHFPVQERNFPCASKLGQRGAILQALLPLIKELLFIIY